MSASPSDWKGTRLPGVGAGTTVLVTGATGAIGREVARAFVQLGATVGIVARSASRVAEVAGELASEGDGTAIPLAADVVDLDGMRAAVAELVGADGSLDVLVNSAAVGTVVKPIQEITPTEIDAVLAVNVKGALLAAIACAPHLERDGGGRIVNIASIGAHGAHPGHAIYGASKAAVVRLTGQLAVDLGPSGITVCSVSPGQTPTRLRAWDEPAGLPPELTESKVIGNDVIPMGRRGELADYVGPVLFLASDLAAYVNGIDIPVEGGVLAKL